jgi:hypothetical protein
LTTLSHYDSSSAKSEANERAMRWDKGVA